VPRGFYENKVALSRRRHAVVPFYGQGMNAAFEDCVVLDECLAFPRVDNAPSRSISAAKRNADALADLCGTEFHRDARQNRVEDISGKKEVRSPARRFIAGIYLPLYTIGYVHAHPPIRSGKTCSPENRMSTPA